jgi:hypothetical protein
MKNCRTCDKTPYLSFNWEFARDGKDRDDLAALAGNLQRCRALKFGSLYQCSECKLYWFLDDDGFEMHRVTPERNELLFAWSDCELAPSDSDISCFSEIGATGPDLYGNGRGEIKIPCSIKTSSGDSHERALVLITKMPPITDWRKSTALGNVVTVIANSDFALPLNVRLATLNACEIRMGYAPTRVQAYRGRYFILNWSASFFSYKPFRGSNISLCPVSFKETSDIPVVSEDVGRITYVYYDWFMGCESLIQNEA